LKTFESKGAVTQASDFKGVATAYARDAQGDATSESSADIGSTTQYDALGLSNSITGAPASRNRNDKGQWVAAECRDARRTQRPSYLLP
jgi:YD repeat-containing protein